ncbi:MAG: transposase [Gammaproteobacteria bacterium]|nr:transposase [Gammaproteobacteria bacterium]
MSICQSGLGCKVEARKVLVDVNVNHPLVSLSQSLPWEALVDTILPDLKKTKKGCWWLGRKLKVRIHLGVYLLQQLFNKTDRQIEYDVKDNAAYQLFCGIGIVEKWHVPDHTKIEAFRSRLSEQTQQSLANLIVKQAVSLGFADPRNVDIDSTVQEANMHYPADSCLLKKLGGMSNKVAHFLNKTLQGCLNKPLVVNMKRISSASRDYFFLPKNAAKEVKKYKMMTLLNVVIEETSAVINRCKHLSVDFIAKVPWGIKRTIEQINTLAEQYIEDVSYFLTEGAVASAKALSFHLKEVACFTKGKLGKKYQFGRCIQLGRIDGNFLFVTKSTSIHMADKTSLPAIIECHQKLFGSAKINSVGTDKGYYSAANETYLKKKGVNEIAIQRPKNIKVQPINPLSKEREEELVNRRSGIEPLIGHVKHGGQLGRSRMKSDKGIESSGYTAVLGFNMRQLIKCQKPPNRLNTA